MFFSISKNIDSSFPNKIQLGNLIVNYDNGWSTGEGFLYKGYSDSGILTLENRSQIENFKDKKGTFCILFLESNKIKIITGKKQKFPVFVDHQNHVVSNLYETELTAHNGFAIDDQGIDVLSGDPLMFRDHNLCDQEILTEIDQLIEKKISSMVSNQPFKLFLSGGFDTLIIASYILKNKIPYELVREEHAEMDHFTCFHRNRILKSFWAYRTIQHWKTPQILLTGAHGDETLLRDATQAFLFFKHHGEDLVEIVRKDPSLYQSTHYSKPECLASYDSLKSITFESVIDLKSWILNTFARDYQHWHLGNTLFFTPFDDLDLLHLSLNLSYDTSRKQLLDGWLCRNLIQMNRPGLLKLLSKNKNHNYFENLYGLYENKIKLEEL